MFKEMKSEISEISQRNENSKRPHMPFVSGKDIRELRREKMYNHYQHVIAQIDLAETQLVCPEDFTGSRYDCLVSKYRNLLIELDNLESDICREFFTLSVKEAIAKYAKSV